MSPPIRKDLARDWKRGDGWVPTFLALAGAALAGAALAGALVVVVFGGYGDRERTVRKFQRSKSEKEKAESSHMQREYAESMVRELVAYMTLRDFNFQSKTDRQTVQRTCVTTVRFIAISGTNLRSQHIQKHQHHAF